MAKSTRKHGAKLQNSTKILNGLGVLKSSIVELRYAQIPLSRLRLLHLSFLSNVPDEEGVLGYFDIVIKDKPNHLYIIQQQSHDIPHDISQYVRADMIIVYTSYVTVNILLFV